MSATVRLFRFGRIDYHSAWAWQRAAAAALREGSGDECLALLEHPPVYTRGRRARAENLLLPVEELQRRGAQVLEVDRGGDVTFHGPGQLVGYPILDLRARRILPGDYVHLLEQVLIDALASYGITGERVPGRPGVWAGGGKIAAIGVRVQGGVSSHGFALNVTTDLSWFDAIIPCGLAGVRVTSMASLLPEPPPMKAVDAAVARAFSARFGVDLVPSAHNPASTLAPPPRAPAFMAGSSAATHAPVFMPGSASTTLPRTVPVGR